MKDSAIKLWMLAFVLVCALQAQKHTVQMDESDKTGILELRFVDSSGSPIPPTAIPIVTVEDGRTGRTVIENDSGASRLTLRYGTYLLHVQLSPAYPVTKRITIRDRFQVAFICFTVAPIELPWDGNVIRGKIVEMRPKGDCRWIRLISAFSEGDLFETKALDDGRFTIENVRPGIYLANVSGNNGICGITKVSITGERIQDIELDGKQ